MTRQFRLYKKKLLKSIKNQHKYDRAKHILRKYWEPILDAQFNSLHNHIIQASRADVITPIPLDITHEPEDPLISMMRFRIATSMSIPSNLLYAENFERSN